MNPIVLFALSLLPVLCSFIIIALSIYVIIEHATDKYLINESVSKVYVIVICSCSIWLSAHTLQTFLKKDPQQSHIEDLEKQIEKLKVESKWRGELLNKSLTKLGHPKTNLLDLTKE